VFDEIKDDLLHILMCMFAYKEKVNNVDGSASMASFTSEIIAANALAEMIVIRVARLGDKRKDVRSIKNLQKRLSNAQVNSANKEITKFLNDVEPVLKKRHETIAHMKSGTVTQYPLTPFTPEVATAIISLVSLVDAINGERVNYILRPSSSSAPIDLRDELFVQSEKV
jgi:hypothetical protein